VNLLDLIEFCGNLLDYDPVNDTYREQLVSLLNDSQTRILTDRHWAFAQRERDLRVFTDQTLNVTMTNASSVVTGVGFPFSADQVLPGSNYELATLTVSYPSGAGTTIVRQYQVRYVLNTTTLYIDRDFDGPTGPYAVSLKRREVYLPADATNVISVKDPTEGIPRQSLFLSKYERDDVELDPGLLGTVEAYLPSQSFRVPAPQTPRGVTIVPAVGQGVRTINLYMVNVLGPRSQNYGLYRPGVSQGFESALSKVATYSLTDTQTLTMLPETLDNRTGLYRRYYFTCPEAGILAPIRIRNADDEQGAGLPLLVDTSPPIGAVTFKPDLSMTTLTSQPFHSRSVRYEWHNAAAYRAIQFYPHPSADQEMTVRTVVAPDRMQEDQDSPLIPADYAYVIAYSALETLTLKVDNPALSSVYERKKVQLIRGMEGRYLGEVPRRIIKGNPTAGWRYVTNPFGKLEFTP